MQQFALASVHPRSIAWLIRLDEWDRFEKIIKYNCAMVGGYFNVIIPLTDQNTISEQYQHFLIEYDPDLVVLAPDMTLAELNSLILRLHPFTIIPWEAISQVAMLDPWGGGGSTNATPASEMIKILKENSSLTNAFVAVAEDAWPDTSRLALVACGDVEPREPMLSVMDNDAHLDAPGYREHFLERLLKPRDELSYAGAYLRKDEQLVIIPAPDRYQLNNTISEEHKFPLSGGAKILNTCCQLQHFPSWHPSFINLTRNYQKSRGTPQRTNYSRGKHLPAIVILVSDNFGLEEAILFWNLRANAFYVTWLPFLEFESDLDAVAKWLDSDYGGIFYWMGAGSGITFSSWDKDSTRLQTIVYNLREKRQQAYPEWNTAQHKDLIFYDYVKPSSYKNAW